MLKLKIPSKILKEDYSDRFLKGLISRVKTGISIIKKNGQTEHYELSPEAKDILLPGWNTESPNTSILRRLLISEPIALKNLNDHLVQQLRTIDDQTKIPTNGLLLIIFGYKKLFNNSKSNAYWLSEKIGRNTCTYCNRIYTFTIIKDDGNNDENRIARPEFDHWFDKADHPLMSISLCNLIPSCPICNSSVKGSIKFDLATHTHPYVHEKGHPDITFIPFLIPSDKPTWSVFIKTPIGSKEEKTVIDMKLNEVYSCHGNLEVSDLMHFKKAYPDGYLKQLFEDVLKDSKHKLSKHDVYRMLFGVEMDSSKFLDRPLSKMKYDILHSDLFNVI